MSSFQIKELNVQSFIPFEQFIEQWLFMSEGPNLIGSARVEHVLCFTFDCKLTKQLKLHFFLTTLGDLRLLHFLTENSNFK